MAKRSVAEQRWLGVVAVPFGSIIACDTYVIQNSQILSLQITKKSGAEMPKGHVRVEHLHVERI